MAQKKSFKGDNPAWRFISSDTPKEAETQNETPPDGFRMDPRFIEKKTRRLQLVLRPSVYARVKAAAEKEGTSVNDYIDRALDSLTVKEDNHG